MQADVAREGAHLEGRAEQLRREEEVLSKRMSDWLQWERDSGFAEEEQGRGTQEGLMRGRKFSCGICQVVASMTESLVKARESEDDIVELFDETCDNLPQDMMRADMLRSDAVRLCKQVVMDHLVI